MLHLGLIVFVKSKVEVSIYFVTKVFSFILNKTVNRMTDLDAFDLQEIAI